MTIEPGRRYRTDATIVVVEAVDGDTVVYRVLSVGGVTPIGNAHREKDADTFESQYDPVGDSSIAATCAGP